MLKKKKLLIVAVLIVVIIGGAYLGNTITKSTGFTAENISNYDYTEEITESKEPIMTSESTEVVTEQETESTNAISNVVTKNYLILIESEAQRENVQKFKAFKESNGFTVTVKSVESDLPVNTNLEASDALKQYLNKLDEELSLDYVLFVGDPYNKERACPQNTGGIIPMKYLYFSDDNHNTRYNYDWYNYVDATQSAFNTPSDIYYAFDFNWDFDKDGFVGEYGDIQSAKSENEKLELRFLLGRIPFSDSKNIETVLDTTIAYENAQKEHSDVLIASGIIGYPESEKFDFIADGAYYANLLSENLKEVQIKNVTLYEKDGLRPSEFECTYPLNVNNFNKEFNKSYDMTYTFGHGGSVMNFWDNDVNNNGYCDENIASYDILEIPTEGLKTGFLYFDGCHTMRVETDSDRTEVKHIQDFLSKGMMSAGIATTRESTYLPTEPQKRIVNFMFQNNSVIIAQEFYISMQRLVFDEINLMDAYIYCYLGDPSLELKP